MRLFFNRKRVTAILAASLVMFVVTWVSCTKKKSAPASGPATIVAGTTNAMIQIKNIESVLGKAEGVMTQMEGFLKGVPMPMAVPNINQIKDEAKKKLGFDPFSSQSYKDMGLDTGRPLAVALPDIEDADDKFVVLLPVNDVEKFKAAIRNILKKTLLDSMPEELSEQMKISMETADNITTVSMGPQKLFVFGVKDKYVMISLKASILREISAKSKGDSLAGHQAFKKALKDSPADPFFWAYVSPGVIDIVRGKMEREGRLEKGLLKEWFPSTQGIYLAYVNKGDKIITFASLPAPTNKDFGKIFNSDKSIVKALEKLPSDPTVLVKIPLNYTALYNTIGKIVSSTEQGKQQWDMSKVMIKAMVGLDIEGDILGSLGNGILILYYIDADADVPFAPENIAEMMKIVAVIPVKDVKKAETVIGKIVPLIEKQGRLELEKLELPESNLYSYEITEGLVEKKRIMELVFGRLGSYLVFTNSRDLLNDLSKDASGDTAYSFVKSIKQTKAIQDSKTLVSITQMGKYGKLFSNMKIPEMGPFPIDFSIFEKLFPENALSVSTLTIDGEALVFRGEANSSNAFVVGVLAAIAIPNFLKFQSKARQSEAKSNLAAIFTAQFTYFSENNKWGATFEQIYWEPEGKNRYTYYLNSCEENIPGSSFITGCPEELKEFLSSCEGDEKCFRAGAVGNIDSDSELDIWVIDDNKNLRNLMNDL